MSMVLIKDESTATTTREKKSNNKANKEPNSITQAKRIYKINTDSSPPDKLSVAAGVGQADGNSI